MIYHQGALLMRGAELSPSAEQAQNILCADLTQEEVVHIKCTAQTKKKMARIKVSTFPR